MNHVKDLLKSGGTAIGAGASVNTDVRFLADSGFDFLLFDTQHAPVEIKQLQPALAAMRGREAIPIVRVGENRADQICYALDLGAKGIVVPMVNTKEEAADMVQWCKYPFDGVRSSAGMRGEWGEFQNYREYMDAVNEQLLIIPMIETQEGLDNIDDILSVPGIDVLLPHCTSAVLQTDTDGIGYSSENFQGTIRKPLARLTCRPSATIMVAPMTNARFDAVHNDQEYSGTTA